MLRTFVDRMRSLRRRIESHPIGALVIGLASFVTVVWSLYDDRPLLRTAHRWIEPALNAEVLRAVAVLTAFATFAAVIAIVAGSARAVRRENVGLRTELAEKQRQTNLLGAQLSDMKAKVQLSPEAAKLRNVEMRLLQLLSLRRVAGRTRGHQVFIEAVERRLNEIRAQIADEAANYRLPDSLKSVAANRSSLGRDEYERLVSMLDELVEEVAGVWDGDGWNSQSERHLFKGFAGR